MALKGINKSKKMIRRGVYSSGIVKISRIKNQTASFNTSRGVLPPNFYARYSYGNRLHRVKGIHNMHVNIRSLGNKVFEVKNIVKEHNPHIIGVSECELRKIAGVYDETRLKVPGYRTIFPKSWEIHGFARIIVYVRNSFKCQQLGDLEHDLFQSIWIKGGTKHGKQMLFGHAYREHTSTIGNSIKAQRENLKVFLAQWEAALHFGNSNEPTEVHIAGDMNLDCWKDRWLSANYNLRTLSKLVLEMCNSNNFSQLVTSPTRAQYDSVRKVTDISCIDHVYSNAKFRCSKVAVIPFGNSDHDIISYVRFAKGPPEPSKTIIKRSYKSLSQDNFLADLAKVNWSPVYGCLDVDSAVNTFTAIFSGILDIHAPWIKFQKRKQFTPWITNETKELIKQRDMWKKTAMELAKQSPSRHDDEQSNAWLQYKKYRNKINNKKRNEEILYKSKQVIDGLNSPENTWKIAKSYMGWKQHGAPSQLDEDGTLVSKASLIAKAINEYFVLKVQKIRNCLRDMPCNFDICKSIMESKQCQLSIRFAPISKVKKLISKLKNSKSTSYDGLDNYSVKLSAEFIAEPLHYIISLSLMQNKFPSSWKLVKIIPLHKKGSELDKKNYRPVALLSPLGKIMEKIVYEQVYEYFSRNSIFHENLHGYRRHRSTQTALIQMYDRWLRGASKGQVSGVVLLDLSAAFDLVDHSILDKKTGNLWS